MNKIPVFVAFEWLSSELKSPITKFPVEKDGWSDNGKGEVVTTGTTVFVVICKSGVEWNDIVGNRLTVLAILDFFVVVFVK